jgi:hypothetical protein
MATRLNHRHRCRRCGDWFTPPSVAAAPSPVCGSCTPALAAALRQWFAGTAGAQTNPYPAWIDRVGRAGRPVV